MISEASHDIPKKHRQIASNKFSRLKSRWRTPNLDAAEGVSKGHVSNTEIEGDQSQCSRGSQGVFNLWVF